MNITKTITKGISEYVFKLSEQISINYNLPLEDILKIWCDQQNMSYDLEFSKMVKLTKKQHKKSNTESLSFELQTPVNQRPFADSIFADDAETDANEDKVELFNSKGELNNSEVESSESDDVKIQKNSSSGSYTCEYVFSKGVKKGQKCPTVAKVGNFCSKHKMLKQ